LVGSLVEIIGGVFVIYLLRRRKLEIALGIGGSIVLLGLVLLAIAYDLISGFTVWIITGLVLVIFASSFYIAVKRKWALR